MSTRDFHRMSREQLKAKLEMARPDNEHRSRGFALINVLGREAFEQEHIPGSINIPADDIGKAQQRFDENKEIVVYCASPECSASPKAAARLAELGFQRVYDYEGGMSDWRAAGYDIAQAA